MKMKLSIMLVVGLLLAFNSGTQAVTIDWVTVGNAGNADDDTGYGSVAYDYRIGKYEVTNGQYCELLNSIAAADPYGLYNTRMGSTIYGGIERTGSTGSYFYSVKPGRSNKPVNYVCWYDAIRFVNWLNNGQGSASTESGTYTIIDGGVNSGIASSRNASSQVWLTSENEWYKAAYYKAGGTNAGYWEYATQSDTVPNNNWPANDTGNSANYNHYGKPPYITDVGAYTFSGSAYGTFDQNGNVWEWNEAFRLSPYGPLRGIRGGSWGGDDTFLPASWRVLGLEPVHENANGGFRVASIPEPALVVTVDIKPQSCPNPLSVKSKGVLPVAILGSPDVNVTEIDVATILLEGVAKPIRSSFEDVAGPILDSNECECTTEGPDGHLDLSLKFDTQDVVASLGEVNHKDELTLTLEGALFEEFGGTLIHGTDCVSIRGSYKPPNKADINKDGKVDAVDFAIFAQNWLQSSIVDE